MEIWRDIKGYEGLYQVSNEGRVKSLERTWTCGEYNQIIRHYNEKLMKQVPIWNDYLRVCLCKNGNAKWHLVHRLVAEAFAPNPDNLPQVNHKDENKENNFVFINENGSVDLGKSNLEWCTQEYNIKYGTRTERTSKPVEAIDDNGNVVYKFKSMREARRNGFADANILKCIKGEYEKSYGFKWRYTKKEDIN